MKDFLFWGVVAIAPVYIVGDFLASRFFGWKKVTHRLSLPQTGTDDRLV